MTVRDTLSRALAHRDNDYRQIAEAICWARKVDWHSVTAATKASGTSLSVVIPARNAEHSLATVLDALGAQDTSGTFEVIVIDDASSDDTTAVAASHPVVDVTWRLPDRVGGAAARNVGTYLAEADTVVYLDADMVLPRHVLADIAVRAHPELVLVGFRHGIPYASAGHGRAVVPSSEPDLRADHRVCWRAPAGVPMFYTGQVYDQPFTGHPLDHTDEFVALGFGRAYHDWDLPRMVVTALVAVPRAAVFEVGGFDAGFDASGWGSEDTHLGAALIAAGCKVAPLRQVRGYHIDPPDAQQQWQAKFATAAERVAYFRQLLEQPAPCGRADQLAATAQRLLQTAQELR
ncbi:glycosyl transferase family 2 [Catellatospora citrea]|nr:glycosyl transferase family 2 [Catellatospora citrea]